MYLGQTKLEPDFVNRHIVTGKMLVPTQPFGRLFRGGKLIALLLFQMNLESFLIKNMIGM